MLSRVLIILLLLAAGTARAQADGAAIIALDEVPAFSHADGFFQHFEDASGKVTLPALLENARAFPFDVGDGSVLNKGYSHSAFWLKARFSLSAQAGARMERYLELDYSLLDDLQYYVVNQGVVEQQWHTGDHQPFDSRPIRHSRFLFPLTLQPGDEKTVYLRVASSSSLRMQLNLWEPFAFHQAERIHLLLDGLYFGILLLMLFYNFCLLISVRDISYFYYIAYTSSLTLFQLAMTGYGFEYGWSNLPAINDHLIPLGICLIAIFVLKFSQRILALKKHSPGTHQFFNVVVLVMCLGAFASVLLPNQIVIRPIIFGAIVAACLMLFAGGRESLRGSVTAKWFLLAWSSLLLGSLILAMMSMGWLPANIVTTNAFMFGSALQVALLSLTLAERLNQINQEKTRMEQEAKRALEVVNQTLQDNNRIKDEFLATISHELRTPMNGVLGCLEHIQHEPISEKAETYRNYADRSARHMMLLVDSLLTYTELQSGKLALDNKPFATRELVDASRELFTELSKRKDIALNFFIETSIPDQVVSDFTRVSQILNNLLDNAIKFTHHGQVEVRIHGERVGANPDEFQLLIQVSDTGIGIAREKLDLIFERFRQVDGAFNRGYGGLGIGLAVIKALLDQMHGSIDVKAEENKGATFTVHIPCRYVLPTSETVEAEPHVISRAAVLRVLVVEDNPVNQMVLKGLLKKQGFDVSTADNGAQAVEWVKENPVDAILMDCQMPIMDGFQATREIRQLPEPAASVPIIAVTANAMSQDRERCLSAGMNDYTSKPIDARTLNKKIIYWANVNARGQKAG